MPNEDLLNQVADVSLADANVGGTVHQFAGIAFDMACIAPVDRFEHLALSGAKAWREFWTIRK